MGPISNRTKLGCALAAGLGATVVGFGDLVKAGHEAGSVTVLRMAAALREHFAAALGQGWVALVLLAALAAAMCWIFQCWNRKESFTMGLSVFAVLTAASPYPAHLGDLPVDRPIAATLSLLSPIAQARAQPPGAVALRDYFLAFEGDAAGPGSIRVEILDADGRHSYGADVAVGGAPLRLRLPEGRYTALVECAGCRRTRVALTVEAKPVQGSVVQLGASQLPLGVQRLYRAGASSTRDLSAAEVRRLAARQGLHTGGHP